MKITLFLTTLLLSFTVHAETVTYDVSGMHCGSCAKSIKAQVCKMDGIEKCEVTVGKVIISTKTGATVAQEQIQSAITKAGDYKITGSSSQK